MIKSKHSNQEDHAMDHEPLSLPSSSRAGPAAAARTAARSTAPTAPCSLIGLLASSGSRSAASVVLPKEPQNTELFPPVLPMGLLGDGPQDQGFSGRLSIREILDDCSLALLLEEEEDHDDGTGLLHSPPATDADECHTTSPTKP